MKFIFCVFPVRTGEDSGGDFVIFEFGVVMIFCEYY